MSSLSLYIEGLSDNFGNFLRSLAIALASYYLYTWIDDGGNYGGRGGEGSNTQIMSPPYPSYPPHIHLQYDNFFLLSHHQSLPADQRSFRSIYIGPASANKQRCDFVVYSSVCNVKCTVVSAKIQGGGADLGL
jgi:hypothetical protein